LCQKRKAQESFLLIKNSFGKKGKRIKEEKSPKKGHVKKKLYNKHCGAIHLSGQEGEEESEGRGGGGDEK